MPFVLRRVKDKDTWDKDKLYTNYPWLKPNQIPTWCFSDLADKHSALSLWHVENEDDDNIESICAAIATTRSSLEIFEYALFDTHPIKSANIILSQINGDTYDNSINHFHRDIPNPTAPLLMQFLEAIWDHTKTGYVEEKILRRIILERVEFSKTNPKTPPEIEIEKINPQLRKKLNI